MLFVLGNIRGLDLCVYCVYICFRQEVVVGVCLISADSMTLKRQTTILFLVSLYSFILNNLKKNFIL